MIESANSLPDLLNSLTSLPLAEALTVNAALKKCVVRDNSLHDAAKDALSDAAKGREGFELLL